MFLLHAIGGNVLNYVPFARALGYNQPVYGIQAVGLDGTTPPLDSLPAMAERYIAEIRQVQPHGPYFLAGGSMGGMIAYEMALQLRTQGETIGLLAMMDTHGPNHRNGDSATHLRLNPARIMAGAYQRLLRVMDTVRIHRARTSGRPLSLALRYREIEHVHSRALARYLPGRCDCDIVLFRASAESRSALNEETLGWRGHAEGVITVIDVPSNHDRLIEHPELPERLTILLSRMDPDAVKNVAADQSTFEA